MRVVREVCVAGRVIDITIRVPSGRHTAERQPKKNITPEAVQKNNDRIAVKKLARIINANFDATCWHDTLTYANPPTPEGAKRELERFLDRVRRQMKKREIPFKWVVVTEYEGHRIHHHLITNAPLDLVRQKWTAGHTLPRPLDDGPNYSKLAAYLIKETCKTFRDPDSPYGCRYSHSRNLTIPRPRVEEVAERQLFADPKAWKGYYIDPDSIKKFEHPITGLPHLEYIMIALDVPRKYYKGKPKKREESYKYAINYAEEQQRIADC